MRTRLGGLLLSTFTSHRYLHTYSVGVQMPCKTQRRFSIACRGSNSKVTNEYAAVLIRALGVLRTMGYLLVFARPGRLRRAVCHLRIEFKILPSTIDLGTLETKQTRPTLMWHVAARLGRKVGQAGRFAGSSDTHQSEAV